jgi:mannitol/fructose-specific phosphotransferase system IIA component (Ntr-type)
VSRLFKDPSFRQKLIEAADADEIFRLIKEEDARF